MRAKPPGMTSQPARRAREKDAQAHRARHQACRRRRRAWSRAGPPPGRRARRRRARAGRRAPRVVAEAWRRGIVAASASKGRRVESAGPIIIRSRLARTWARSPGWPHHQVAMLGRISGSPSSASAMRGRKARRARVSRMPEPRALTRVTLPCRSAPTRPGRAEARAGVELERIGEGGVEAAPEHADRPEAGDGAHHHPAVLDGEVLALEQHEAEIAGDVGVLEIGVVERAGRQDGDARVAVVAAGPGARRGSSRKKPASRWTFVSA